VKTLFVLNPRAGRNRRRPRLREDLERFVRRHRLDAVVAPTAGPGHATALARAALAAGCQRVVAVGGDGTMNEVAQGLVGSRAVLALVPCGSGNGLALHLHLPTRLDDALALLVDPTAETLAIDTGEASGHPFFNAMGLGFDAEISRRFNRLTRRGLAAYVRTVAGAVGSFRPERLRVSGPAGCFEAEASLLAVGNSDQYGNNAFIAPGARVNDGLLNLTLLPPLGLGGCVVAAARLFAGTLARQPGVVTQVAPAFTVERDRPGLIHTDGETHETGARVHIAIRPASLRLHVPAATADELATFESVLRATG
jgi:YegS/Rv2252/BmrU family lipid kinase